ncbi:MAG: glycosyltransferase family 39 protein [candidate division NC10 bacterium]|nr:glycosyltransferase family 39 protein [candidate division NC10 bacterium]MBI2113636.1 glycosyltransferase family 39 protein [candidate division NC10 bacterium]MBI2457560.1 glycosyltransferase family 39 protein [candidate division NC10 bacterium]
MRARLLADNRWKRTVPVVALLALALLYRLWILFSIKDYPVLAVPAADSAMFDAWARDIAQRSFWGDEVFFFDPLYPYFLGIFYALFGHHPLAATVVQAVLGVLGLWMLFEGARRLFGYPVAVAALAAGAFYRTMAFYDVVLVKDFLGPVLLEAAFLAVALVHTTGRHGWWAGAGAACALAGLVRGNLLLLVPGLVLAAWLVPVRDARRALLALAGAVAVLLPVALRNSVVGGEFVLSTAEMGTNLYTGNHAGNDTGRYEPPPFLRRATTVNELLDFQEEAERRLGRRMGRGEVSAYWRDETFRTIAEAPGRFLLLTAKRAALLTNRIEVPDVYYMDYIARRSVPLALPAVTFGLAAPLAVVGLARSRRDWRRLLVPYLLLALPILSMVIFFVFDRYRLPSLPFVALFAGMGATHGWNDWKVRDIRGLKAGAALLLASAAWVNVPLERLVNVGRFDFTVAHYNDAVSWERLGRPAEAARELEEVFRLRPEYRGNSKMTWFAGRSYERGGDPRRAAEYYRLAAEHTPGRAALWVDLARVLLAAGDVPGARQALEQADGAVRRTVPAGEVLKELDALRRRLS